MNNNFAKRKLSELRWQYGLGLKMVAASLFLVLLGFINSASAFQTTSDYKSLLDAYNSAIYDSSVYKFSNVRKLYPLKFDPVTRSATVVTLTDYDYTEKGKYKLPFQTDMGTHYTWVSAVPEVQNVCRGFSKDDLKLNLKQLLGLKPKSSFKYFVTFQVTSGQIFRPTSNPDPTTEYPCSVTYSATDSDGDSKKPLIPELCGEVFPKNVCDVEYKMWFLDKMMSTYVIADDSDQEGYPWTRLGYTYNWKPGADKYGASEYVIKLNSIVTVKDITPYQDYCKPNE